MGTKGKHLTYLSEFWKERRKGRARKVLKGITAELFSDSVKYLNQQILEAE